MISWMQTVMQKHYKWLFSILLVVIIVSFVFVIGNTGQGYSGGPKIESTKFYGYELGRNSRDVENFSTWTAISLELNGRRGGQGGQVLDRMVALNLADTLHIPEPTPEQMKEYITTKRAFINPTSGQFSADEYLKYMDNVESTARRGIDKDTVLLVLAQDYRIDKVNQLLAGPGYVLPYQAEERIKRNNTTWSIDLASFSKEAFEVAVSDDPEAVKNYFNENIEEYRIPEKIALSYVKFSSEDYRGDVIPMPSDADLQITFARNKSKYVQDDAAKTPQTFLEAKDQVLADWQADRLQTIGSEKAGEAATRFALDIYNGVYEKTLSKDSEALGQLIADRGLELIAIPPFDAKSIGQAAAQTGISFSALRDAMSMDATQFYSSPTELQNKKEGAVVLFFDKRIESRLPEFADVEAQVTEDYKAAEKQRLFLQACEDKRAQLETALAAGESFEETAKELGLSFAHFEDFKLSPPPEGLDRALIMEIADLAEGELSQVIDLNDSGKIVKVLKKEEPDMEEKASEVDEMLKSISTYTVMSSQQSVLAELIAAGMPEDESTAEEADKS